MAPKAISFPHDKRKKLLIKEKSNLKIPPSMIIRESKAGKVRSDAIIFENFSSKKDPKDDLCSSCGIRAKGPGFRFLCRYCFRKAGDEPVYSINPGTFSKDIFFTKIPK